MLGIDHSRRVHDGESGMEYSALRVRAVGSFVCDSPILSARLK